MVISERGGRAGNDDPYKTCLKLLFIGQRFIFFFGRGRNDKNDIMLIFSIIKY